MDTTTPHFPIYIDYAATTPVDQRRRPTHDSLVCMNHFGNPLRAATHGAGKPKPRSKSARAVAQLINADPGEVVWTSAPRVDHLRSRVRAQFYKRAQALITVKNDARQSRHDAVNWSAKASSDLPDVQETAWSTSRIQGRDQADTTSCR